MWAAWQRTWHAGPQSLCSGRHYRHGLATSSRMVCSLATAEGVTREAHAAVEALLIILEGQATAVRGGVKQRNGLAIDHCVWKLSKWEEFSHLMVSKLWACHGHEPTDD